MKQFLIILIICSFVFACKNDIPKKNGSKQDTKVKIETLLQDSTLNVRALEIIKDSGSGYFVTSNGNSGIIHKNTVIYPIEIVKNKKEGNFRSLASTKSAAFCLSIESPAKLYKIGTKEIKVVYKEDHPKAFYNSMTFWNDKEGIAIGDPTDGCMSIIITRDGGDTWTKLSCDNLPKTKEGEAAFAASDTNIAIVGDKTWVATGGTASRILFSPNKGNTWEVFETPMVQGISTTGTYSIDFYDELNGFAIGGDYTKPKANSSNKMRTKDGGKTWELVGKNENPGYRSCVKYMPNSDGKSLIAVGFDGIDLSYDSGETWSHISDDGYYTFRFLSDNIAYAAGKGRISKLVFKK